MERARLAELTPVFDIFVRRDNENGTPFLTVTVTNLGKGAAAGVKAWAVAAPSGGSFSDIQPLDEISQIFLPTVSESYRINTHWTSILMGKKDECDLILHIRYRDALSNHKVRRFGFAIGSLTQQIRIVEPPVLTPLEMAECRH